MTTTRTTGRIDSYTGRWLTAAQAAAQDAERARAQDTMAASSRALGGYDADWHAAGCSSTMTDAERAAARAAYDAQEAAESASRAAEAAARAAAHTCAYCDEYLEDADVDYCDRRCQRDHERWGS